MSIPELLAPRLAPAAVNTLLPAHLAAVGAAKVRDCHLLRKAIVYVRQSSPQQVLEHKESSARQYALADVAVALGWPRDRVEVIDRDQGRSGQNVEGRPGFQYLLAELGLDHVGIILGLEASRLARSDPDWAPLVRLSGVFRTLLCDYDGLYDPGDFNDRLLLGLKGIMSEAELHFLHARMHEGRLNKARRGELFNHAPLGYLRQPGGGLVMDPDEQVQSVVRLIFEQFERQGSLHGLLRYLVHHDIKMPIRPHGGPDRGQLQWRRPNRETLQNVLHHPVYAGFYRWGHRSTDPRKKVPGRPGTGRTINKPEACSVLLEERCPAYISPEAFWANQQRLADNRARADAAGAVRHGPSLLGGIIKCGRCGQRMMVNYGESGKRLRYNCGRAMIEYAEPVCQGLAGERVDELVAGQLLAAVQPASLELSMTAADDIEQQRQQQHDGWRQQLERARYQADRAFRQYDSTEPENRLVVRQLEQRWEETLQEQRRLEEEYKRFCASQPSGLSESEREQIRALAADLPGLWSAETTSAAERQRIVRLLVEEVVVTVKDDSEQVDVTIRWSGGQVTAHQLIRPVQCYKQMANHGELLKRIHELHERGRTMAEVAEQLNQEGFHPPKRSATFNGGIVTRLLAKEARSGRRPQSVTRVGALQAGEWLLSDLARQLEMPQATLHRWVRVSWVNARKLPTPGGHWVIWADEDELTRMAELRTCPRGWSEDDRLAKLTRPKERNNQ